MKVEYADVSSNRRAPLKPVPFQKRRKPSEDCLESGVSLKSNCQHEEDVLRKKDNGKHQTNGGEWPMKRLLTIDTLFADSEAASTSGERDHLVDSDYASLSVTPATSEQVEGVAEVQCCVWDWRTTHIGGFMKKNRIISLKRRFGLLKIEKPLPTYDADIGKVPSQKSYKRCKYNPHQECFVTDVSHRSRRCTTFRRRPYTRLFGPINDSMLQKVQVPVDASYSEPKVEYWRNKGGKSKTVDSAKDDHGKEVAGPSHGNRSPLVAKDFTLQVGRLSDSVADFVLDVEDIKFWKQLNWKLWTAQSGSMTRHDENNHQLVLPPIVVLRKVDFVYVLSLLETTCYNEIHLMLLEVLNVPNQDVDDNAFCEICQSDHSDPQDPIVFCEGCELAVHQNCYAFDKLPKKDWFCNVCATLGPKTQARCRFCPLNWGTMKQTIEGGWAHFACAVWQQSLRFDNLTTFEPISHEWDVNSELFTKTCSVCDICYGSCITCSVSTCRIPFHPTCALRGGLFMYIEDSDKSKIGVDLFSFCVYHSEKARSARDKSNGRMESILLQLNVHNVNPGLECYKKSRLCKMESSFDRFVNWKRLAEEINLPQDVMKSIFAHWVKRRRQAGNRPLVHLSEANEVFVGSRFREDPARNAVNRVVSTQVSDEEMEKMIRGYTKAHCILDKFRNLATLSVRREKIKLQLVRQFKEAFNEITAHLEEDSHLNDRFMNKIAVLLHEHIHGPETGGELMSRDTSINSEDPTSGQHVDVSRKRRRSDQSGLSPRLRRTTTTKFPHPFNKIQEIFAELFDLDENLSKELFKSLPADCL